MKIQCKPFFFHRAEDRDVIYLVTFDMCLILFKWMIACYSHIDTSYEHMQVSNTYYCVISFFSDLVILCAFVFCDFGCLYVCLCCF